MEPYTVYAHDHKTFKFSYDIEEDTSWHQKLMTPFDHAQDVRDACVPSKAKRNKLRTKRKGRK